MLPRMQKTDPPTHLIRSKNGDYLRGRVTGMDEKTLKFEVRLESKDIPRDRISRIIWLHADELDPSKKPQHSGAGDASPGTEKRWRAADFQRREIRRERRSPGRATCWARARWP